MDLVFYSLFFRNVFRSFILVLYVSILKFLKYLVRLVNIQKVDLLYFNFIGYVL